MVAIYIWIGSYAMANMQFAPAKEMRCIYKIRGSQSLSSFYPRKDGEIMRKRSDFYTSELECPVCHRKFPIQRKAAEKRERGHIKDIWCPFCKKKRKFIENGRDRYE